MSGENKLNKAGHNSIISAPRASFTTGRKTGSLDNHCTADYVSKLHAWSALQIIITEAKQY